MEAIDAPAARPQARHRGVDDRTLVWVLNQLEHTVINQREQLRQNQEIILFQFAAFNDAAGRYIAAKDRHRRSRRANDELIQNQNEVLDHSTFSLQLCRMVTNRHNALEEEHKKAKELIDEQAKIITDMTEVANRKDVEIQKLVNELAEERERKQKKKKKKKQKKRGNRNPFRINKQPVTQGKKK